MEAIARRDGAEWIEWIDSPGRYRVSGWDLEEMAAEQAAYALDVFNFEKFHARSAGGSKSKRGPTYTDQDLDLLEVLDATGSTKASAARIFGVSESTIARMRRVLEQRKDC